MPSILVSALLALSLSFCCRRQVPMPRMPLSERGSGQAKCPCLSVMLRKMGGKLGGICALLTAKGGKQKGAPGQTVGYRTIMLALTPHRSQSPAPRCSHDPATFDPLQDFVVSLIYRLPRRRHVQQRGLGVLWRQEVRHGVLSGNHVIQGWATL
jgi:hypothetical protein